VLLLPKSSATETTQRLGRLASNLTENPRRPQGLAFAYGIAQLAHDQASSTCRTGCSKATACVHAALTGVSSGSSRIRCAAPLCPLSGFRGCLNGVEAGAAVMWGCGGSRP
jgi:hypothetical protein